MEINTLSSNSLPFFYTVNGWVVASETEFPELWPIEATEDVDVFIHFGEVPEVLEGRVKKGYGFQIKPDHYILTVKDVGRFMATHGKYITIDPLKDVALNELRIFILASVFGAISHQKKLMPIHASAIEVKGKAILFAGNSGMGKSTTAASFLLNGYKVITDDVSVIYFDKSGNPLLNPGTSRLKLTPDVAEALPKAADCLEKVGTNDTKSFLPIESENRPVPCNISHLFHLKKGEEYAFRKLEGSEKFNAVLSNVFRFKLVSGLGVSQEIFRQAVMLSKTIQVYELTRPENSEEKLGIVSQIENLLKS